VLCEAAASRSYAKDVDHLSYVEARTPSRHSNGSGRAVLSHDCVSVVIAPTSKQVRTISSVTAVKASSPYEKDDEDNDNDENNRSSTYIHNVSRLLLHSLTEYHARRMRDLDVLFGSVTPNKAHSAGIRHTCAFSNHRV
jgi:hypothetical protein